MGVEYSRSISIDLEERTKNRTIEFWKNPNFQPFQFLDTITMGEISIKKASIGLCKVIQQKIPVPLRILEVGSGSGLASKIMTDHFTKSKIDHIIIKTDIATNESLKIEGIETGLLSHEAVKKYGNVSNVLLLISPPPSCHMDYYAIKEFELQPGDEKYVIYLGELGASDGGEGMYKYMMNDSVWDLIHEELLSQKIDSFGGPCEKCLYIFRIDRQKHLRKKKLIAQSNENDELDDIRAKELALESLRTFIIGKNTKTGNEKKS
jgi:hypothetical protein